MLKGSCLMNKYDEMATAVIAAAEAAEAAEATPAAAAIESRVEP